jgi:hypothetical protein
MAIARVQPTVLAVPEDGAPAAPPGAPPPVPAAASAPEDGTRAASKGSIAIAIGIIVIGGVVSWLADVVFDPTPFKVASNLSAFAALFVAAAAIERLLEPFTRFFGQVESAKSKRDSAVVAMADTGDAQDAASQQAALNQARANRSVMVWALATGVSMVFSAACGFYLLHSIAAPGGSPNAALDILLTGLVIGSGTKPLHDLVSRVQSAKEKAQDPPETRGG